MARVTVCLSVYNGATTLAKALDTVYSQTYRDFDVLVLDDGSTDDSATIASTFDCRVLSVQNAGLGAARKRLVEEATGELIAFIDHDDFWLPAKLEKQVAHLDMTKAAMVHTDGWYVYEDGREVSRDLVIATDSNAFDHILPSNQVIASTSLFRRQEMLDAGNFVVDTVRCSDWYGWLILAPHRTFAHLPEKLVRYSVLSTSLANSGYRFHEAQHYLLTQKILPRRHELFQGLNPQAAATYTNMLVQRSGIALSSMARAKAKLGEKSEARRLALKAIKTAPTVLRVWSRSLSSLL
ncbi:MAG: glycosyltransferase family 2 protein [Fimbriimonas sp.]